MTSICVYVGFMGYGLVAMNALKIYVYMECVYGNFKRTRSNAFFRSMKYICAG